jgi:hypothetical protein
MPSRALVDRNLCHTSQQCRPDPKILLRLTSASKTPLPALAHPPCRVDGRTRKRTATYLQLAQVPSLRPGQREMPKGTSGTLLAPYLGTALRAFLVAPVIRPNAMLVLVDYDNMEMTVAG